MRFYNGKHRFWCGVDLHARTMYICILSNSGEALLHKNVKANPQVFLRAVKSVLPNASQSAAAGNAKHWTPTATLRC